MMDIDFGAQTPETNNGPWGGQNQSMFSLIESVEAASRVVAAVGSSKSVVVGSSEADDIVRYGDGLYVGMLGEYPTINHIPVGQEVEIAESVSMVENAAVATINTARMSKRGRPAASSTVEVGSIFENKKDLRMAISLLAVDQKFCFKVNNSDKSRLIARCVDPNCKWRVNAKVLRESRNLQINKLNPVHTCGARYRDRYVEKATSKVLAELLYSRFSNGKQGPRAYEIPGVVLSELKLPISYTKAWYTREAATATCTREDKENVKHLSTYLEMLERSNSGSITDVLAIVDEAGNHHLRFLFVAIGAAVSGWSYVRKVIGIDITQLRGKNKGCLVTACCQDGNFQILPLAFGIVDSVDITSWVWFLSNLSRIVNDDQSLVFICNGNRSLREAMKQVYPQSTHTLCVVQLFRIVKDRFNCGGLANMATKAAQSYTITDFKYWWCQIKDNSPECANYLSELGFSYWSRSHCKGTRYNLMSSTICDSFSGSLSNTAAYPIITMIEILRTQMMVWFKERRDVSEQCCSICTPNTEKLLVGILKEASGLRTRAADEYIYQVDDQCGLTFTVDLRVRTCTCKVFQSLKIPCMHALSAIAKRKDDMYSFIDSYYWKHSWTKIYAEVIMPIPSTLQLVDEDGDNQFPKRTSLSSSEPGETGRASSIEGFKGRTVRSMRCGRCSKIGHNRTTCKIPI